MEKGAGDEKMTVAAGLLVGAAAVAATLLMAAWWLTEAVPLAATALVPLVLFPLLGIATFRAAAAPMAAV